MQIPVRTHSAPQRPLTALFAFLLLAACATPTDVRHETLLACETYTAVLERVVVWKPRFNDTEWRHLQEVEAITTPLCMTPTPTASGLETLRQALDELELLLASKALEGE